jgi:hypothetical protein
MVSVFSRSRSLDLNQYRDPSKHGRPCATLRDSSRAEAVGPINFVLGPQIEVGLEDQKETERKVSTVVPGTRILKVSYGNPSAASAHCVVSRRRLEMAVRRHRSHKRLPRASRSRSGCSSRASMAVQRWAIAEAIGLHNEGVAVPLSERASRMAPLRAVLDGVPAFTQSSGNAVRSAVAHRTMMSFSTLT